MKVNRDQPPLKATPGTPPPNILLKSIPSDLSDNTDKDPDTLHALMVGCQAGHVSMPGYVGIVFIPDSH